MVLPDLSPSVQNQDTGSDSFDCILLYFGWRSGCRNSTVSRYSLLTGGANERLSPPLDTRSSHQHFTLDEGCLPCVRRLCFSVFLREMTNYPVRELHSGRRVWSQLSTLPPDGMLFTLYQGCDKPVSVLRFHSGLGVLV